MIKKVKLIGIYGLYNFGCEAIVRGTYKLLKNADPNVQIVLYTHTPEYDKKAVADLEIEVRKIEMKSFALVIRILNKLARVCNISKQIMLEKLPNCNQNDLFISIGGDIYTVPLKDIKTIKNPRNYLVDIGEKIIKNSDMIIWGASIGPFGDNLSVNNYFFNHFKKMKQIIVREKRSYDLLVNNNLKNINFASDPAYFVDSYVGKVPFENEQLVIGINLSPLSIKENGLTDGYNQYSQLIEKMIEKFNCKIILLPHVISPFSEKDNDFIFLENIYKSMKNDYKKSVVISSHKDGFLDIKRDIIKCDIVVTARMHCAINAICENIPTIFVCYSQKGYGMCEYVYGNTEYAIDLKDINTTLIAKIDDMNNNHKNIKTTLKDRMEVICSEEDTIVEVFKGLIS